MPSLNIQFHMLFSELIEFAAEVSTRFGFQIELEKYFPKTVHKIPFGSDLAEQVEKFGPIDCIWLVYGTTALKKEEKFMLAFGRQRGNRLAQSQFGGGSRNPKAFQALKNAAGELRRRTRPGIWVITEAGNVGYNKKFRISNRAETAARAGEVELVGITFTQSFHVDPPEGAVA